MKAKTVIKTGLFLMIVWGLYRLIPYLPNTKEAFLYLLGIVISSIFLGAITMFKEKE